MTARLVLCHCALLRSSALQRSQHDRQLCRRFHWSCRAAAESSGEKSSGDWKTLSPAEALIQATSVASAADGRVARGTQLVLGADDSSVDKWRELDEKVNEYPGQRSFKAIGTGGEEFVSGIVAAIEGAVGGRVQPDLVNSRPSREGKYVSVSVGPVWVENSEQVIAVYEAMRRDERLKWYL